MTEFTEILSRLGLAQYTDVFNAEGFETWETLLDITESDLEALGVKLGHRRVLQREIALARGLTVEQLSSPTGSRPQGRGRDDELVENKSLDGKTGTGTGGKRKYRRHPKPDENAPERAPSAYVIFSNRIREELKPDNLSFTAIAKRVGERWQELLAEDREPFELEASAAKERYHAQMAEYKTTRSYREYQQYLAEFKAKSSSTSEGKRPKLLQQESTNSSGSYGSQTECQDPRSSSVDTRQQRYESISSVGPYSSTSGLPSPASVASGPFMSRAAMSSTIPLGTTSPMPTSPSTPSIRRASPATSLLQGTGQIRASIETYPERTVQLGLDHHVIGISPPDNQDPPLTHKFPSRPFNARRSPRQTSPHDPPRWPTRVPALLKQHTSDESSKSSIASTLSSDSTKASSLFTPVTIDEENKAAISLPPLSTVRRQVGGSNSYLDSATRPSVLPLASRTASSSYAQRQRSPSSPYTPMASTGMKFESLQLPLPYNISFGHHPLPRPEHEGRLANIFDLQDIPRERHSLRNLTLQQQDSGASTAANTRSVPEPQHPPHRPNLPTLPSMSRGNSQDLTLHPDADPLSVLAYAGRLVDRENRPPS